MNEDNCRLSDKFRGYDEDIRVCKYDGVCQYQHRFAGEIFCSLSWTYAPAGKLHPENHHSEVCRFGVERS